MTGVGDEGALMRQRLAEALEHLVQRRTEPATSSWVGGTGSLRSGSAAEISAARDRIASTGFSAAAATP